MIFPETALPGFTWIGSLRDGAGEVSWHLITISFYIN